jgi:hypothetical protein
MGLENLGQLKVSGALILAIVSFGFLVYDSRYAHMVTKSFEMTVELRIPGPLQVMSRGAIALSVLSVLVLLAMLTSVVVTLLGLDFPNVVVIGLFGGGATVFLGVIITAGVVVSAAKPVVHDDVDWERYLWLLDSRNYDENLEVQTYVDSYEDYEDSARSFGTELLARNRSLKSSNGADERRCVRSALSRSVYDYIVLDLPLSLPLYFASDQKPSNEDPSPRQPLPPDIDEYSWYYLGHDNQSYVSGSETVQLLEWRVVPICFGLDLDEIIEEAHETGSICDASFPSAEACAPGWSEKDFADFLCKLWEKCMDRMDVDTRDKRRADLKVIGAVQQDYPYSSNRHYEPPDVYYYSPAYERDAWVLPAGWNKLDVLKDYWSSEYAKEVDAQLPVDRLAFYASNLVLLVIGVVGWVIVIAGLVLGLLSGRDENKD